jgi:hypothetical protein
VEGFSPFAICIDQKSTNSAFGQFNFKRMKKIILINALIWAALLLGAAGILNDHPNFIYMFFGIVVAFSILHGLLADFEKRKRKTCTE